jgi:hypothetical protein
LVRRVGELTGDAADRLVLSHRTLTILAVNLLSFRGMVLDAAYTGSDNYDMGTFHHGGDSAGCWVW